MPYARLLCLISCFYLPLTGLAQSLSAENSAASSSPAAVQVVYVVDGSHLLTYDIDPQSLYATKVGTLPVHVSTYPSVTPAPNDRFLYYTAYDNVSEQHKYLWVYTTDASGVPQTPAVQLMNVQGLYGVPLIHPSLHFVYMVYASPYNGTLYSTYTLKRYTVDSNTGKMTQPHIEAQYQLPNGAGGSEYCALIILGFNKSGDTLYHEISCGYHGGSSSTYYERSVNLQTGALGPDAQIYSWNNATEGGELVQFVGNLMFDFVTPNNYQPGVSSVDIYPAKPNTSTKLVHCTASMLEACGYASWGTAHPSGNYIFMAISQDTTQIDKVELTQKKIVDTGNYIPYRFSQFSPDGTMAYGRLDMSDGSSYVEIYRFNVATAQVTQGGIIYMPSYFDPFFAATRY